MSAITPRKRRCEGTCSLPAYATLGARATCPACGAEYVVTDRWKAVGTMWEPAFAVDDDNRRTKKRGPYPALKRRRDARRAAASHMRVLGYTVRAIADDLGCSTSTVHDLLREADESESGAAAAQKGGRKP